MRTQGARLVFVSGIGWSIGLLVEGLITDTLYPGAPLSVVLGILLGAGFLGAALAASAWGRP